MDGLGLAETTPGPLIMVVQFVGFMGGWQHPQGSVSISLQRRLAPSLRLGPRSRLVFFGFSLGGPYIERLRGNVRLTSALSAITAAVVGVVLNLAVWFSLNSLFPDGKSLGLDRPHAISLIAFIGMWKWKWDVIPVVIGSGLVGLVCKTVLTGYF